MMDVKYTIYNISVESIINGKGIIMISKPDFVLPEYNEIPGVGLFLEQVSKYINEYITVLNEPELTGSMISNYVKKDIIANPVKKQYGRDQIACLIFIAFAKIVLSLEDINALLKLQENITDVQSAYTYFRNEFMTILSSVFDGKSLPLLIEDENDERAIAKKLVRNLTITVAHKVYLDWTFDDLSSSGL